MPEVLHFQVDDELYRQLTEIAQVTGEHPVDVVVTILRAGTAARVEAMVEEAEAERRHLEAELTAVKARLAGLNGSSKAPQRPVQPRPSAKYPSDITSFREAVRGVLGSDRSRTWRTGDVIEQLATMGYDPTSGGTEAPGATGGTFYSVTNATLRALCRDHQARNPVRGEYAWAKRPSAPRS